MIPPNTGILLTNIGTPYEPSRRAVRSYLKKFLTDPRVVEIPRLLWLPILYGLILPFRSRMSAQLYQQIWMDQGSPLHVYSEKISTKLAARLNMPVALGMHYSEPSIKKALENLTEKKVTKMLILPLFPQYSGTTTARTLDDVAHVFKKWRVIPEIQFIRDYSKQPMYIEAIAQSIRHTWETKGKPDHLLFSFHGIPEYYAKKGDPYPMLCRETAESIANTLQIRHWSISFQSRLGRAKWLTPYTDKTLIALGKSGIKHLQVVCPGFPTDCLETLEEINIRGKKQFQNAGGKIFHYIPALNDSDLHIEMLAKIILSPHLDGFPLSRE